jgi:UDP-glucose 4-epimerase
MRVLVTGGAGFIGSHLVDAIIADGHEAIIIDSLATGVRENIHPQARFYEADIRDATAVETLFARERPEVLIHQAAQLDVRRSVADPAYDADVNVVGTLRLLQAGLQHGLKKVIFASSGGAIYGDTEVIPTPETHPAAPISPYGVAKLSIEHYLHYYQVVQGLPYVALRYANVYGPRQNPHGEAGVIAIFSERLLRGQTATIYGDGLNSRDYVYVADVVAANLRALASDRSGAYNVGTGIETDVNTVFRRINDLTEAGAEERHGEAKAGEQRRSCLNTALAQHDLGWQPEIGFEEGLRRTVEFFIDKTRSAEGTRSAERRARS